MRYDNEAHAAARRAIVRTGAVRAPCSHCGDDGPHDGNGSKQDPTSLCAVCGELTDWDQLEELAQANTEADWGARFRISVQRGRTP